MPCGVFMIGRNMWWYLLLFVPVAGVIWLFYEWMQHTLVQYTSTAVELQKLPQNTELRICLMSDLHNNRKRFDKLVKRIFDFAPDMILLAGDFVDKHKTENLQAENFFASLSDLGVPMFYSMGNHESSLKEKHPEEWQNYEKKIRGSAYLLDNSGAYLQTHQGIYISGLSLPKEYYKKGKLCKKADCLPELFVPENSFHIMMAHNPEYATLYDKYHADFIVSGHLHGGLLRLPGIGGVVSPRLRLPAGCDAGLATLSKDKFMYVSRGLGSHTIPLRFFNRVEVNFLVLKGTGKTPVQKETEME